MHRPARLATVVLAGALSLGIAAPALAGKPHDKGAHAGAAKDQGRTVLRGVDRLDASLARVLRDARLRRLPTVDATAVAANVADDRALVDALAADVASGSVTATDAGTALRTYRPGNYTVVVNHLRFAAQLVKALDAARVEVVAASSEEAALDEAAVLVGDAVTAAHQVTMTSGKDELRTVKATLEQAQALLESVAATDGETAATI